VDIEIPSHNFDPSLLDAELADKCVESMKLGKASGPDDSTGEHILYAHPILVMNLCCLFKAIIIILALMHSYVPADFGLGNIVSLV